jgi:hypothetical protein
MPSNFMENGEGRTFVAYLRVSTDKQGKSGLGLEAQQAAICAFLRPGDRLLSPPFLEVESGRSAARPKLREAITRAQSTGAVLLVAKLDRLARNLSFLRSLTDGGVDVAFCDMPHIPPGATGRFLLSQMALVAELEAGLISERTKAALAAEAIEAPAEAMAAQAWLKPMPAGTYVVQHAAMPTYEAAQQWQKSQAALSAARIVAVYRPNQKMAYFVVVSGPFATRELAFNFTRSRGVPADTWVRTAASLREQFTPEQTSAPKR